MENKFNNLNASQLHMLSEYGMIFENPKEDIEEKLRLLKEECMIKYEIMADKYIKRKYEK